MRVLVSGDRNWDDREVVEDCVDYCLVLAGEDADILELVHGAAPGLDSLAGEVAAERGIKVTAVPAEWDRYRRLGRVKAAGPERNKKMLDMEPDFLIAFHAALKESRGTKNCVKEALKRGIPVVLVESSERTLFSEDPASLKEIESYLQ